MEKLRENDRFTRLKPTDAKATQDGVVRFLLALVSFWLTIAAFQNALADKFTTHTTTDARSLGMGDAAINTSRGSYSVFYNPANIAAKDTGTSFELINFQVEGSDGLVSQGAHANSININNLSNLYGGLKNNPNTFAAGRYSVYPNITIRNFSLGMLYEVNQGAELRASDGALRVKARDRFAPVGALSFRLFKGIFRIGASVQYLSVGDADDLVRAPINATALDFKRSIKAGGGLVSTAGMTLTLPFRFLPSFSVVARDIGNSKFSGSPSVRFGDGTAATKPMTFDFASSLTVYLARRLEMKLEADYRDFSNKIGGGRFRHVAMGTELIFYDVLRFRAGIGHGYLSYGFGLNTRRASLDVAAYADEKDDRLRGAKDQRYVLQYTWEIFK